MILKSAIVVALFLVAAVSSSEERKKRQANYGGGYGGNYNGAAPYRQAQPAHYQQPQQQQHQHQHQQVQHYPPRAHQGHKQGSQAEEEKNEGPHPLELLLEKSKFDCGSKKDGYYADGDVGCQAFHYCVGGHKHSMMCPDGTVFHQVHLNCVPADQDICSKADKFYFVNDYLHKPLDQRGPNNSVVYHQRYYPDGYAVGDPFIPPQDTQGQKAQPVYAQQPAYQPAPHQGYVQQPAYQHSQKPQPKAPFTPQQAHYGPPRQHAAPKAVYPQAQAVAPYQAQPRPVAHQAVAQASYQAAPPAQNYAHSAQQTQALQAHRAAEAAVLAQHYQAQQAQAKYQQQQQPQHHVAYGGNSRPRYGQY